MENQVLSENIKNLCSVLNAKYMEQYFGAVPKRSATDLAACLVHDIEVALARENAEGLPTGRDRTRD
ncbi:uncharacterized protein TRIVIDRAFT_228256 [Trichoderma virens Gv29-8]|uniref:Uncharacterized protein n=1 Tax=Hypocrea virens (strain Gv29-8 / FGSC 10586) TaxID=413071 RepID=G9NBY8_HYPVG|nr:uncharacterized protein TRIVIDRAFT_228256 [Trichoderma virens Gv29-8]EHK15213.1 hypothetical protein TRIVIDRAFT_228256 [Trichoderma virens Gv29-8]UKZ51160.1 hypothetical protein TrVGV298_004916 [Trichoderma virens]